MALFQKKKHRTRRRRTWLDIAAKDAKPMVNEMKVTLPALQAALVTHVTGVEIKPEDIKIVSPEEKFKATVTAEAVKSAMADPEYLKDVAETLADSFKFGTGRRHYRRDGRDGEAGEDFYPGYYPGQGGYDPMNPLTIVETYRQLEEAMKGRGGGLGKLLDTEAATELVKLILMFFGKQGPGGSQLIAVDVDGHMIEMTMQG